MSRRRLERNKELPENVRCRGGYYSWRNPIDGRELGLGSDKLLAYAEAAKRNAIIGKPLRFLPDAELTKDQIVSRAILRESLCAIYFLIAGSEIIYVGQSTNVHKRISEHLADGIIVFDRFHIEPCDASMLDVLETQYILQFRPAHNKTLHQKRAYEDTV